jgi:hypothetical protein
MRTVELGADASTTTDHIHAVSRLQDALMTMPPEQQPEFVDHGMVEAALGARFNMDALRRLMLVSTSTASSSPDNSMVTTHASTSCKD